jgi:hypothetical protein
MVNMYEFHNIEGDCLSIYYLNREFKLIIFNIRHLIALSDVENLEINCWTLPCSLFHPRTGPEVQCHL